MKLPLHQIRLFLTVSITLIGLFLFHQKSIITKTPVVQAVAPVTNSIHVSNSPTCIRDPDIQFFMYHYIRFNDPHDAKSTQDLSVDPRDLDIQLSYIRKQADANQITLMLGNDFLSSVKNGCFPGKRIWIFTSDDGWTDAYTELRPIAKKYNIPFFFGIIVNRIDTTGFITHEQVKEIANDSLFTISSHSMTHNDQDKISIEQETIEICESKKALEKLINTAVLSYIYPAGRMSPNSKKLTKDCGYDLAWSTGFGSKWDRTNPSKYDINRIRIHNTTTLDLFRYILKETK